MADSALTPRKAGWATEIWRGRAVPDFKRNVYGGTIGGPIVLPRLYNGRNKTFFFYDFEGNRANTATTRTVTVPTLKRVGDFTDTRAANGRLIAIYNPYSTYRAANGSTLRQPFPDNLVPRSMFRPTALKALETYPQPTSEGVAFTHANNFFAQGVNRGKGQQMDFKIDHYLSDKQRFMSRYSVNWGSNVPAVLWSGLADPFSNGDSSSRTQNFVFDFTRTHSASTLISLRYGALRQRANTNPKSLGFDQTSLGLPSLYLSSGIKMFPNFTPEGYQFTGQVGFGLIGRGNGVQRPNLIGDPRLPGSVKDRLNRYFNEAAFSRPAPDTFGSMPRTLPNYRSPGIRNGDVAVFKNVSFSESRYVQLRLEAFNVTNTATFATPHMTFGASNFGVIDNYAGGRGPRELQVAVKFYF